MGIQIARAMTLSDELRTLIGELDAELAAHYPPEQRHGLKLDELLLPHVRLFMAHAENEPVGCGAIALFDGFAELKRMYVRPAFRSRGIADAILSRLSQEAASAGRTLLQLETGSQQIAAMKFYERSGFKSCGAFGSYAAMPAQAVAESRFYEKRL